MKIAILGGNHEGILAAKHFNDLGAEVKIFDDNLQNIDIPVMKARIERVHKRFLRPLELIPNHSRLHDLFRLVYSTDPVIVDNNNLEAYNELKDKLGEDVISHLQTSMEYYEDFDIVIEAGALKKYYPLGAGGALAVGEKRIQDHGQVIYGIKQYRQKKSEIMSASQIALVGEDQELLECLDDLIYWLKNKQNIVTWITHNEKIQISDIKLNHFLNEMDQEFQSEIEEYQAKIEDWKNLDDFIKVKIPRPAEPIRRLNILYNTVVSSVDKLIDQPRLFLSLESAEFKTIKSVDDIQTLSFDFALTFNGSYRNSEAFPGLSLHNDRNYWQQAEPGLYFLNNAKEISLIENNLQQYFSRA